MHIYFVGIGGSGLSPLAQLALDCGYVVSGSDLQHSFGTLEVEKRGVIVNYEQSGLGLDKINLQNPIDWVVYSSACKQDHPELVLANKLGIKLGKRDSFINFVLSEKNLNMIAIAGSHGKTTTTAMVVWLFKKLNIPISYLIGSNISFGPAALYQSGSEFFIYEADEFDRNFLNYKPFASVITNIDYDHPDTYPAKNDYYDAFLQFTKQSRNVFYFFEGVNNYVKAGYQIQGESSSGYHSTNDLQGYSNQGKSKIALVGIHNRENAFLAIQAVDYILNKKNSISLNPILVEIVNSFPGTQRRFEKISNNIYSDYAHHPTEIAATLQLASELSDSVVVVYQPHQNIRQHEIKELYAHCFDLAFKVYWLPTYLSREDESLEILTPQELISYIKNDNNVKICNLDETLKTNLINDLSNKSLVLAMGAGSVDGWLRQNLLDQKAELI